MSAETWEVSIRCRDADLMLYMRPIEVSVEVGKQLWNGGNNKNEWLTFVDLKGNCHYFRCAEIISYRVGPKPVKGANSVDVPAE